MQIFTCTGNLTKDVDIKQTSSGKSVCSFTIAVNRPHSEDTDFFNVEVWGKQAENCGKYLKKGSKVGLVGYIRIRSYEDKDGKKRYATDVVATEVEFLSTKQGIEKNLNSAIEMKPIDLIDVNENLPF
jgi:single-strand DNA-binding protein